MGYNAFEQDRPLVEALEREGAGWAHDHARAVGEFAGGEAIELGRQANENPPVLRTHDRYGNRIDEVEFHPAWHRLLDFAVSHGAALAALDRPTGRARHVARAAVFMPLGQAEAGHGCPISMTYSAVPALAHHSGARGRVGAAAHVEHLRPAAGAGRRQGRRALRHGDDREAGRLGRARQHHGRAPAERRRPRRRVRDRRATSGSAPRRCATPSWCSRRPTAAFPASCFRASCPTAPATASTSSASRTSSATAPTRPARSSSHGAWARMVGEEGRGVPTIIEMVNHTRLDCVLGSAGGMRAGVAQATHHAAHRSAFGKLLIDQPADAERAGRPVRRIRGGDHHRDAPRARLRPVAGGRARDALQAPRHRGLQVLDLQARAGARDRVARVPRRQRLRRGVRDAAPLPRVAAQLDLGGLGQRDLPRRPARAGAKPRSRSRSSWTRSTRRAAPSRGLPGSSTA